jgi:two-component system KDP operon response regulator KdpE
MTNEGPRLLIVDDERAIRRFLTTALAAHGYQIFEATNGQEALTAVI